MAGRAEAGADWQDDELDLIITDYFAMLREELAGRPLVKARHNERLRDAIGRSHRSIEFKHMNISAVLAELGRPTIRGYRPMRNYQDALLRAIERRLDQSELSLEDEVIPPLWEASLTEAGALFEGAPPERSDAVWARNPGMERLVRKFDPGARDARNRELGKAGEHLAFQCEQSRLRAIGRPDLARRMRWVAEEDGDGAGYDILSFNEDGAERLLEVKTTCGSRTTPFLITRNEYELSRERAEAFRIFRVHDLVAAPAYFRLRPPLEHTAMLTTEVYRASFAR
ncbi:MAG: DUF3883 domain-containing protein [Caulobacteraceae bacterium]